MSADTSSIELLRDPLFRAGLLNASGLLLANAIAAVDHGLVSNASWELEAVMSDNGSEFRSQEFERAVERLRARHLFIYAGRPQSNGCVERVQETILEECWKPAFARYLIPKYTGLRLDLDRYLRYDKTDRAHTGRYTRGRTPDQVIGKEKMWARCPLTPG